MGDGEVLYELKEASVGGGHYLKWSNQPRRTNLKKIGVNLAFGFVVVVARSMSEVAIENERDYSQQLDWMAMRLAYHENFSSKNLPRSTRSSTTMMWKLC